jgi:PEGA domain
VLTGTAKADYEAARLLYDDNDFQGALEKLKASYSSAKEPRLLWNMAACEKNLRHYSAVLELAERFLTDGGTGIPAQDRADAEALIAAVQGFVTKLTLTTNEPGASVTFDEQQRATTPLTGPIRVDMGQHTLRVSKPGFTTFSVKQDFQGGGSLALDVTLVAEHHEGRFRIVTDPSDVIQIDRKVVGTGLWEGALPSGAHAIFVSAKGKQPYQTEVVILDNQTNNLHVSLRDEPKQGVLIERSKVPTWLWIAGGTVAAGAGIGAYFLLKPSDAKYQAVGDGSWGSLSL